MPLMPQAAVVTTGAPATPDSVAFASGGYYGPNYRQGPLGGVTMTQNQLCYFPIWIPNACTINRIGLECTTGIGSTFFRLGLYAGVNPTSNAPTTLLVDAGQVSAAGIAFCDATVNQTISTVGWYWLACVGQGGTPECRSSGSNGTRVPWLPCTEGGANNPVNGSGYTDSGTISGALPGTVGTLAISGALYFPYLRAA